MTVSMRIPQKNKMSQFSNQIGEEEKEIELHREKECPLKGNNGEELN